MLSCWLNYFVLGVPSWPLQVARGPTMRFLQRSRRPANREKWYSNRRRGLFRIPNYLNHCFTMSDCCDHERTLCLDYLETCLRSPSRNGTVMNSNAQRIVCLLAVYLGLTYSQNMEKLRHNRQLLFALLASQVFVIFGWSVLIWKLLTNQDQIALDQHRLAHKKAFTHTIHCSKYWYTTHASHQ